MNTIGNLEYRRALESAILEDVAASATRAWDEEGCKSIHIHFSETGVPNVACQWPCEDPETEWQPTMAEACDTFCMSAEQVHRLIIGNPEEALRAHRSCEYVTSVISAIQAALSEAQGADTGDGHPEHACETCSGCGGDCFGCGDCAAEKASNDDSPTTTETSDEALAHGFHGHHGH